MKFPCTSCLAPSAVDVEGGLCFYCTMASFDVRRGRGAKGKCKLKVHGSEDRIRQLQERAEKGLPLFGDET